jgi:hypothetical protein
MWVFLQDKKVSDMQHQNLGQKPVKVRSSVPIVSNGKIKK